MSKRKWTIDQKNAIDSRGGSLLVSAAAGSGKTAVLVQRVIERIIDPKNPCNVDALLIVTFTKAAAAEIRERIGNVISDLIVKSPEDTHLARQQMLLPSANIWTIDKFCNELVRENFHEIGISQDFKILDDSELSLLRQEAVSAVLEELYQENTQEFQELVELLFRGRDDSELANTIIKLYNYSRAYPFPEEWLERCAQEYANTTELSQTPWGQVIIGYIRELLDFAKKMLISTITLLETDEVLYPAYCNSLERDLQQIDVLMDLLDDGDWDDVLQALETISFGVIGRAPKGYGETPLKQTVKANRDYVKGLIQGLSKYLCVSSDDHMKDMEYLLPIVKKLVQAIHMFGEKFFALKLEQNSADFNDVEHMALGLLIKKENGKIIKTPLALDLAQKYVEILVDEYQDTNELQNMLFESLSNNNENLFIVGDVKQSIYRFRRAMPEVFLSKKNSLQEFKGNNYPSRITLGKNFRSRKGIAGMVNFTFKQLMSKDIGELEYDASEELVSAAEYPVKEVADVEMHILNLKEKGEEDNNDSFQARYIAKLIRSMLDSGMTIKGQDGERPVQYRDFCILLRSTSNRVADYVKELSIEGIPTFAELNSNFFDTPEISVMLSLLRVIDNPVQDIPLLSLMMSPIYGFTPDDLADIRINDRKSSLYACVTRAAQEGNEKCIELLEQLKAYRLLSATLSSDELIRRLYDDTGYLAIAQAMKNSEQRKANLYLLLDYANKYAQSGKTGLTGFIRYIDRIQENKGDVKAASCLSEAADVVRIMTIHKSKGLEFPICIVANCAGKFNSDATHGAFTVHPQMGIGLIRRDATNMIQYKTIPYIAGSLAVKKDELSEELRVLYVALTRAKERLITVMGFDNPERKLNDLASKLVDPHRISPFSVLKSQSYADWLLSVALRHQDAYELRRIADAEHLNIIPSDFLLKVVLAKEADYEIQEETQQLKAEVDFELLETIQQRLTYQYPYKALSGILAKRAASEMNDDGIHREFFASKRPAFLSNSGITPAQIGTATHRFLQHAEITLARKDLDAEIQRLISQNILTAQEAEAIDRNKVSIFVHSELADRMVKSELLMRERRFAFQLTASYFDDTLPQEMSAEKVFVQGVVDCAFIEKGELVIVDYKTDKNVTQQELVRRYANQLEIYKKAMMECTGLKVKQTIIYSLFLEKLIEI